MLPITNPKTLTLQKTRHFSADLLKVLFLLILSSSSKASAFTSPVKNAKMRALPAGHQVVVWAPPSMEDTWDELAKRLVENIAKSKNKGKQYWVAIAGGPGSGKSTAAEAVRDRLNKANGREDFCVVLPVDGFHYTKEKLKELDPPEAGNYLLRRGAPWTMDAELCVEMLTRAKNESRGDLPTYCRELSDPVPGGVTLLPEHRVVLVEGLYLLLRDDPRWEPLQLLWDETWFIRCPSRETQRQRIISRSLKTWSKLKEKTWGFGEEGAAKKVDANDARNMDIVAPCEKYADVIIENT